MAKFLNTTGVSYHLEELIKNTKDRLILISPYLRFTDRIKEHIDNLANQKNDVRIIYRENKLHPKDNSWLENQIGIRTSLCENLHAKCYINENEAIITSMNLYEFSQQNNNEMGIYISRQEDLDLYHSTLEEARRLLSISEEIIISNDKGRSNNAAKAKTYNKRIQNPDKQIGYCIRSGVKIPFNIEKPLSSKAFEKWREFRNPNYPEKYCHFSGEPSNGETCLSKPVLNKNWRQAKETFNLIF